jgi:hypothetical protein
MDVKQQAQFHAISIGLEAFNSEFDGYPDSNAVDSQDSQNNNYSGGNNYCGAMRLAEAMVGQDLKGFNPSSRFERQGFPNSAGSLSPWVGMPYPPSGTCGGSADSACYNENLRSRKMYLELEHANAYMLKDIYDNSMITSIQATGGPGANAVGFDPNTFVLCDSYNRVTNKTTGKKIGMPILYYRADQTKLQIPTSGTSPGDMKTYVSTYTYNFWDNQTLIDMGMPWSSYVHHLAEGGATSDGSTPVCPQAFYNIIRDKKISSGDRSYRTDSYILISAGFDGDYGTSDDIYNFGD